jgi:hypothetical protein
VSSYIFYRHTRKWLPPDLPVPDGELDSRVLEYMWMERYNSPARILNREHDRRRKLDTMLCVALSAASLLFGAAMWPQHEAQAPMTKRVTMNECNGLLNIYGTRCN